MVIIMAADQLMVETEEFVLAVEELAVRVPIRAAPEGVVFVSFLIIWMS